jgi:very-short-patch-repair endonuclease
MRLRCGNSSFAEHDYFRILCYFFNSVERQFSIYNYKYDFKIGNLLVEFDGEYWHRNKKDIDDEKDRVAVAHGHNIYRVPYEDRKNPIHMVNIQKVVNEANTNNLDQAVQIQRPGI